MDLKKLSYRIVAGGITLGVIGARAGDRDRNTADNIIQ